MFSKIFKKLLKNNWVKAKPSSIRRSSLQILQLEDRITPTIFLVTNTSDDALAGSLRAAINSANTTAGDDTIQFSLTGASTYSINLNSALPTILNASTAISGGTVGALNINGLGAPSLTINGNSGNFNIFSVASGGNLTISGVTVSGASNTSASGGGFNNAGTLSVSNANISANSTSFQGGGIFNSGALSLFNSTIASNSATGGGGIYNSGTMSITNSTISSNNTTAQGAGIFIDSGTVTVINSTIASNNAVGQGGGIINFATLNISNTIIGNNTKNNTSGVSGADFSGTAPILSVSNLITSGTLNGFTTVSSSALNLGALQNNGGPTSTMALGNTSAAVGTGNATVSNNPPVNALDQRGYARSSTAPSIGAFEFLPATQATLTTFAAGAASGSAFTTQPIITFKDAFGNTVNTNSSVTMTVSTGATTVGTTTVSAVAGIATFSGVGISGTAGTAYTLTFASSGLAPVTQSITPTFGTATQAIITTQAVGAASGSAFTTQPVITIQDSFGNTVTNSFASVTMTVGGNGTTVGTSTINAKMGIATFTDVGISGTANTRYDLTFTSGSFSASQIITATYGTASQLIITTPAAGSSSGLAFTTQPVITVQDAFGNTVANSTASVTMKLSDLSASTVGTTSVDAVNGVASFTNVGITGTAGTQYALTFSSFQLASATQNITPAPLVAQSTANLAINAPTITINGNGFDTTKASNNTVSFSSAAVGTVTAATSTQLTVTFSTLPTSKGSLTAIVTVTNLSTSVNSGAAVQVATIVDAPTVTLNSSNLAMNAPTVVINGTGFNATTPANNFVTFNNGAVGTVTSATSTQLTVSITTQPASLGSLTAVVTSNGGNSGTAVQVANIIAASAPAVTLNTATLAINATSIVINGTGFSTTLANNTVAFTNSLGSVNGIGTVTAATSTQLTVTFSTAPTAPGNLLAVVTLNNAVSSGTAVQVAAIVLPPSVILNTSNQSINTPTITIRGTGFDTNPSGNTVTFNNGTIGTVTSATSTQLTVTITTQPTATGNLTAIVNAFGSNNTVATQVATIVPAVPPIVTSNTASLAINSPTITILGTGFNTTISNNTVAFNLGAVGTVTAATPTQLTVTFSTLSTSTGNLTAVVTSFGLGSGTATQVATIVAAPTVTSSKSSLVINATTLNINGTGFNATTSAASQLSITTPASGSAYSTAFTTQPVISIKDANGNTVTSSTVSVTMTVSSGATTIGTTTVNAVNGVATFSGVGISGTTGTPYTLTFASSGLSSATQNITISSTSPGPAYQLAISTPAAGAASGSAFSTQPVITIKDINGNTVTSSTDSVTMTVSTGATTVGATTVSAVNGIVTFKNVGITGTSNTPYTLTFTSTIGALITAQQNITISATSSVGAKLSFITPVLGSTNGSAFNTQPILTIQDINGNTVTSSSDAVTIAVSGGDGNATMFGSPTTVSAINGIVAFSGVGISGTAGTAYTLTFTSGSLISATQTITVSPSVGAAAQLSAITLASGSVSGSAFSTQPIITIQDSSGNTVSNSTASVTMSVGGGDGQATIFGTATVNAVAGIATFSNVGISGTAGVSYLLTFASSGLSSKLQTIQITSPSANTVTFNNGAIGTVTSATATQLTVSLTTPPSTTGSLTAVVTSFGGTSGSAVEVANVVTAPTVTPNTTSLAINASTITINGTNFSSTASNNTVTFNQGAVGTVLFSTSSQLTVRFTTNPSPPAVGSLTAVVTTDGGTSGSAVQVASIVAAPSVTSSTSSLTVSAPTITINGSGFDTTPANNSVNFNLGAAGTVTAATSTQLTVTFTTPPNNSGSLTATVTAFGGSSGNPSVQVATITPTVSSTNPPNVAINSPTVIITGTGFNPNLANFMNVPNNTVVFNNINGASVTGTVTAATSTQLTVTFGTAPTSTGILTAVVTANGVSSGTAVQVANIVAAPTVTSTTSYYLATNTTTITIAGTGFDTTPSNNTVSFSTGAGTVTSASSDGKQLIVTFTSPPSLGTLTAVVTTGGGTSGSQVQVGTVVAAPIITVSSANLTTNATTLTITGTNFIPIAANNTVALSLGAVGVVTLATSTQLVISLVTPPSSGSLTAVVTTFGGNSNSLVQLATSGAPVQVATVIFAPTVNSVNPPSRAINAPTLIITGTGFSATPANNTVAFNDNAAGVVTAATSTQLTVTFTTKPLTVGFLTAVVTANGISSGAPVQVANIVAAPTVTSTTTNLGINATTLTITGTGFDANTPLDNIVTLSSGAGLVTSATATSLTLTFSSQPFLSNLTAVVNSFGGNSGTPSGTPVQVATIIAPPTITTSTASLAINAPTIVINGTGYSNTAANNTVTFNNGAVGTVTTATSTQLTVTFTTLPSALGTLSASIVSNGITSGNPVGTLVQVATIVPAPTVSFSNANIASVVPFITILGTGFNGTTPSGNTVVFSNGAVGTVTAATSTSLIVTYTTQPTAGALTAVVTSFGGSSGVAVQVATIIGPTISSVTPSSGTPSGGTAITIVGTNFVSGASIVTIGGLPATSVVVVSSTMITAVTPPGTLGTIASVVVTTIDGKSAANSNASYAYSLTPVNITITTTQTILRINQTATITFTLSASSTNFILADVVVTGGTLSNFSGSGTLYTATYTPTAATYTTGSIYVPVNAFTDAYGTQSNPSNIISTIINTIAPPLMASTSISGTGNAQTGIQLVNPFTGALGNIVYPFPNYNGNISIARMDYNQDGIDEVVAGAGPGGGPAIAIINSVTGVNLAAFFAFSSSFTGGVFVAAGDVNNDGLDDIIAGTGPGGGPVVTVFSGQNLAVLGSFFAYQSTFTGGVTVAAADVNGDGYCDIITGAGPGGGPLVKVFDVANSTVLSQWFAYSSQFTGGVFVAAGDLSNDGNIEVITGAGAGGGPAVGIFNSLNGSMIDMYFAYPTAFMGSVRVAVGYGNNDPFLDILTGAGPGGGPVLSVWSFPSLDLISTYFVSNPSGLNGIWVA